MLVPNFFGATKDRDMQMTGIETRRPARRRRIATVAALCMIAAANAGAANWNVDVGGGVQLVFSPATLTITAGDTVTFTNQGGFHNVAADDGSFRCAQGCDGAGGNGDPSSLLWTATVTFPTPGTVGYHCEIHGAPGLGMFGTITVDTSPPPPPPPQGIDSVPDGNLTLYVLLGLALVFGAATRWRRQAREPR
jgi:plastocyanin